MVGSQQEIKSVRRLQTNYERNFFKNLTRETGHNTVSTGKPLEVPEQANNLQAVFYLRNDFQRVLSK